MWMFETTVAGLALVAGVTAVAVLLWLERHPPSDGATATATEAAAEPKLRRTVRRISNDERHERLMVLQVTYDPARQAA